MGSTRVFTMLAVLLVAACSDATDHSATGSAEDQSASLTESGVIITKAEYGEDWPYTVDSGVLYCDPPGSNVVLKVEGKVYALNGRAIGNATEKGYLDARETITLRDENGYFTIGNTGKIIERGLSMCH